MSTEQNRTEQNRTEQNRTEQNKSGYATNQERTEEYLKKFNREATIKHIINDKEITILDVGANEGQSLIEFKQWWKKAKVHCFEPQSECWDLLYNCAEQFKTTEVFINKVAAGSESDKELIFYSHDISTGISGFNKVNLNSKDSLRLTEEVNKDAVDEYKKILNHQRTVKTIRLDDYMNNNNIKHVDLLKIDTQGFEPEVLDGAGKLLKNVDVVLTELMFYDYYDRSLSFTDIEKYLIPAGFKLYDISHIAKNPMNGRTDWVDVIYVNDRL